MNRLFRVLAIILGLIISIPICVVLLGLLDFLFISSIAQQLAYAKAPPQYPGSQLIESYTTTGTESMGVMRTYRTTDNLEEVLPFMETRMPGFVQKSDPTGTYYQTFSEDDSALARHAADLACTSLFCLTYDAKTYPGVSVRIYSDPIDSTGTIISVYYYWPAP